MKMNPTLPDFFPRLMEKYHDEIIFPYKSNSELLATLKMLYQLELVDYEEAMNEIQGFIIDKNIVKEKCDIYLLKLNSSSEVFYQYHATRFGSKRKIFLLVDKYNDEFVTNNQMFQTKINILRGINKKDVDNFTQALKVYLNLFYLYEFE